MTTTPRLQHISEADLDGLIAELRRQGTTELVLLGSNIEMPASVDQWPQELRDKPRIYQLNEPVRALAGKPSGGGTVKSRTKPLNHQLGDVRLKVLSMS